MLATYHNHSNFSDGKASIAEIVAAAERMGIGEVGVSDHFVVHPKGEQPSWSMPARRLNEYVAALQSLRSNAGSAIRVGLEVDWFPGHADAIRRAIAAAPLDYVIGSVHYVGEFTVDGHPDRLARLTQDEQNEIHAEYWRRVHSLAQSRLFDIVAHIDLTKKFGYRPTIDLSGPIAEALDAIAESRMVVELNTSGWHKPCADAYPSLEILRQCWGRGIAVTLSADAHQPDHLLRDFERGAERLAAAGYDAIARFAQRQIRLEPLHEAVPAT